MERRRAESAIISVPSEKWFFFEVERGIEVCEDKDQTQEGIDHVAKFLKRIHQEDEDAFESEDKARIQNIHDKWEASPWLNRTGWPAHLDGFEPDVLRESMRAIEDDEPVLQREWAIFNSVLDKAYEATIQCSPGSAELFEIERKEAQVTTQMPFNGKMEDDAWPKYKKRWKILMYHHTQAYNRDVFTASPVNMASLPLTQPEAQKLFKNLNKPYLCNKINKYHTII
ncbi:hypothetical protein FOYG_16986 [Fusarium oxysporum NRRL 32931]|uniref:Uncharacterized protein n=1 Tax=Fusarium oxysporum NRRL 32931 TaxID=660029 RepID=W9HCJ3_FUSOX|nr:hypothetical protein FOYG_16986 [Fusarium oxysporum NRRL 32931]